MRWSSPPEQCSYYGGFAGEPTASQLGRFFYFDKIDLELIATRRQDHNRSGIAVQLGTVRSLGKFLENPSDVPGGVVGHVAEKLSAARPASLAPVPRPAPSLKSTRWRSGPRSGHAGLCGDCGVGGGAWPR